MNDKILCKIDRIYDLSRGAYLATSNECFDMICTYLKQLKIFMSNPDEKLLDLEISKLELNNRAQHCLRAENINTVGELIKFTRTQLLKIPNLGKKSIGEIEVSLKSMGLKLQLS